MFFPIGDDNPSRKAPVVTYTLIAINVAVFLAVNVFGVLNYGLEHAYDVFNTWGFDERNTWSPQLLTSLFLHAGIWHLLGNMWVLYIVGDNVEDKLGRVLYTAVYFTGGVIACWAYVLTSRLSHDGTLSELGTAMVETAPDPLPLVGASGAIFCVMGMYLVFFPEARIRMFLWLIIVVDVIVVRAKWIIGAWVLQDLILTMAYRSPAYGSVATAAHVGGAAFGIVAGLLLKRVVGGGAAGDAWDVHTGFASHAADKHRTPWAPRNANARGVDPTESQLVGIEEAIERDVKAGNLASAIDLYPRYEAMAREKPLDGEVQIEIAHEFFRRGLAQASFEAYRRYLETDPEGEDVAEALFRVGVLLARAFERPEEARPALEVAARTHDDPNTRAFALAELERLG